MSAEFNIKLHTLKESIESIHDEAKRLGIKKPELKRYQYMDGNVTVTALTPESEKAWATYLTSISQAKIALIK